MAAAGTESVNNLADTVYSAESTTRRQLPAGRENTIEAPGTVQLTRSRLSAEIMGKVLSHVEHIRDLGNLGLCGRYIAFSDLPEAQQGCLYRELPLLHYPQGLTAFSDVASGSLLNHNSKPRNKLDDIHVVIYEDVMLMSNATHKRVYDAYCQRISRFRSLSLVTPILNKIAGLKNLHTIEYHPGLQVARSVSAPGPLSNVLQIAMHARDASGINGWVAYGDELHKHKTRFWGPSRDEDDLDASVWHVHRVVKVALESVKRTDLLTLKMRTLHTQALHPCGIDQQWPRDNKLDCLDIAYHGFNVGSHGDNLLDIMTLSDPDTASQFSNVRYIKLGGVCLQRGGWLNLAFFGCRGYCPDWPRLSKLELRNVQLRQAAVHFIKSLSIYVVFGNVIWHHNSIAAFERNSRLTGVEAYGVHVIGYELGSSGHKPVTRVFFAADDQDQADSMAEHYSPHFSMYQKRPIPWIPHSVLQSYLLNENEAENPMSQSKHAQHACGPKWQA